MYHDQIFWTSTLHWSTTTWWQVCRMRWPSTSSEWSAWSSAKLTCRHLTLQTYEPIRSCTSSYIEPHHWISGRSASWIGWFWRPCIHIFMHKNAYVYSHIIFWYAQNKCNQTLTFGNHKKLWQYYKFTSFRPVSRVVQPSPLLQTSSSGWRN